MLRPRNTLILILLPMLTLAGDTPPPLRPSVSLLVPARWGSDHQRRHQRIDRCMVAFGYWQAKPGGNPWFLILKKGLVAGGYCLQAPNGQHWTIGVVGWHDREQYLEQIRMDPVGWKPCEQSVFVKQFDMDGNGPNDLDGSQAGFYEEMVPTDDPWAVGRIAVGWGNPRRYWTPDERPWEN